MGQLYSSLFPPSLYETKHSTRYATAARSSRNLCCVLRWTHLLLTDRQNFIGKNITNLSDQCVVAFRVPLFIRWSRLMYLCDPSTRQRGVGHHPLLASEITLYFGVQILVLHFSTE